MILWWLQALLVPSSARGAAAAAARIVRGHGALETPNLRRPRRRRDPFATTPRRRRDNPFATTPRRRREHRSARPHRQARAAGLLARRRRAGGPRELGAGVHGPPAAVPPFQGDGAVAVGAGAHRMRTARIVFVRAFDLASNGRARVGRGTRGGAASRRHGIIHVRAQSRFAGESRRRRRRAGRSSTTSSRAATTAWYCSRSTSLHAAR